MDQEVTPAPRCIRFVLSRGAVTEIEYCSACGIFHINIESISLRFGATALRDLHDTLSAALARYQRALDQLQDGQTGPAPSDGLH